uniref:Uncharacterized protein n=1 Tax=Tanacetum cinerariifolium TaxID=118510 RepID=A0A699HPF8_TANCI|nr:hypothetical protein [Tanacetum cinerariifolium]
MGNVKKSVAERTRHKRQYDRRMNERQMQSRECKVVSSKALNASLVVTECSGTKSDEHITISSSGTYITHVVDVDIRPVNDQEPSAEVHLTAQHNVLANEQQHTDQSEPSYDTYMLEKVDSNTTPDLINMCHRGGEIDQDAEQDQVKITPHYFPKVRESVFVKCNHVIASGSSRNSTKESINNQTSWSLPVPKSSRGMLNGVTLVDHSRNSSSFSDSKHFVCLTCKKSVINANHDDYITKVMKEVNSRAKVQSPKSRKNIKPAKRIPNANKSERRISKRYRFSPNKSFAVHEKPNTPRSCIRWKPTGRIFKTAGLRWIPTGKLFTDCTTKVDSEPLNVLNGDITKPYECGQTLNVSASTLNLSAVPAAVAAPRAVDPAGSPSSTTIDQDVPFASTSPTI